MTPQTVGDWIAWAGLVLPLATLAFSAVWYVRALSQKQRADRYSRLWELMRQAGAQDGNIAGKMAAFYEMRKYPEYAEVIIRLCEDTEVVGGSAALLKKEMLLTAEHLRQPNGAKKVENATSA
jgi:hypothetical protein